MAVLRLVPTGYLDRVVRDLEAQVQAEYVRRYGGPDETVVDAAEFDPPGGVFLVGWTVPDQPASCDGAPVATGGLRRHDQDSAELKRMFVVAQARRRGYARELLAGLESWAAALGYRRVVLETGTGQPEAIALYTSSGYEPVPGFGHYRSSPLSRSFAKSL